MISKEGSQLSYLNLRIIQPPYGISIDQTSHIYYTILTQWFPCASEKVKSAPTPFKTDSSFEFFIAETLPDNPAEIHILEDIYLGKFSS